MNRRQELEEFVERVRGLSTRANLEEAAVAVIEAFESVGIEPILLKGPALAQLLYRPDERRSYSDIDLMIAPGDLTRAREALTGLGYVDASDWFNRFLADSDPDMLHAELWTGTRGADPVLLDLHWRLEGCEAPADVVWEALSSRLVSISLCDRPVAVLGRDALALHLAIHAAQHGGAHARAIADLKRGVERWPLDVWRAAARLAELVEASPAFAAGLRLTPAGADLANALELAPAGAYAWKIENRDSRPRGAFHLEAMTRASGIRARLAVLRRALFPTRAWIGLRYPWAAHRRRRAVIARALHLIGSPAWAARAWRYRRRERRSAARE